MTARVVWCNQLGCDVRIFFARSATTGAAVAFEAQDREPFADTSIGAEVIVAGKAWRPGDLIAELAATWEIADEKARDLVTGYPWHRRHGHDPEEGSTGPAVEVGPVDLTEDARDVASLVTAALAEVSGRHGADLASAISRSLNRAGLRVAQTRGAWLVGHVAVAVCAGRPPVQVAEDIAQHDVVREVVLIASSTAAAPPPVVAGRPVVVLPTP